MDWAKYYSNFIRRLRGAGVSVRAYTAPRRNWHAKIAIRLDSAGRPAAAIVGSSNLTGPAFGEGRTSWNYECDVTIWRPDPAFDTHFRDVNQTEEALHDPFEVIPSILDPGVAQPNEEERMTKLLEDIYCNSDEFELVE